MLFNSLAFPFFFLVVYTIYCLSSRKLKFQNCLLLLASYIFYSYWDWRFLSLVILSTLVDFYCGLKIEEADKKKERKHYLLISLGFNLGLLFIFKYYNFFVHEFDTLMQHFGITTGVKTLSVILPLGISFYTFQTIAYTVDVYRKKIDAEKSLLDYALYVSFFPQLVAGPIERAQHLIPQIKQTRIIRIEDLRHGMWLIMFGYFLKLFVADNLGLIVDEIFALENHGILTTTLGAWSFAFQIYGDFAGYTFIAIGVSRMMGFRLMTNFLFPYFITNPRDFWRHWHISLSTWLRDYLYIPLGGNRGSKLFTMRNLMITMVLGGLWHGAAWNFVIWGVFHGLILCIYFYYFRNKTSDDRATPEWNYWVKAFLMFQLTCLGWLFFRVDTMDQLYAMTFGAGFSGQEQNPAMPYLLSLLFYVLPVIAITLAQFKRNGNNSLDNFPYWSRLLIYLFIFYAIFLFGEFGGEPFIYFQF